MVGGLLRRCGWWWGLVCVSTWSWAECGGTDLCRRLCDSALPNQISKSQCERGCRLFNIAINTNWSINKALDLNITRDQCYTSCSEAYDENSRNDCFTGCTEMLNLQKETWLYFEQRGETDGILEVEVSLVSDPALWEQTISSNVAYKMPQTLIRTMPLQPGLSDEDSRNWSPCIPRTNEIPRWIIAAIAIALTIFTLYVSFILPSRSDGLIIEQGELCDHHRKLLDDYYDMQKDFLLDDKKDESSDIIINLNLPGLYDDGLQEDYYANFLPPPPKYTLLPPNDECKA